MENNNEKTLAKHYSQVSNRRIKYFEITSKFYGLISNPTIHPLVKMGNLNTISTI
jgi:hypothetical protein